MKIEKIKRFFKDRKNIAITILGFVLLISMGSGLSKEEYNEMITENEILRQSIENLEQDMQAGQDG